MKNHWVEVEDKIQLRKRSLVESVFNVLKKSMNLEHSRPRSPINFLVHILACVNAYNNNFIIFFVLILQPINYKQTDLV
jgi:hypothetical protein